MSVTASELGLISASSHGYETVIREQLALIDAQLRRNSHILGRNIVEHQLPTSFTTSRRGLERSTIERIIYSSIIKSLMDRGFEVRILITDTTTTLYVSWVVALGTKEFDAMTTLIRKCAISRDQLQEYLVNGGANQVSALPSAEKSEQAAKPKS